MKKIYLSIALFTGLFFMGCHAYQQTPLDIQQNGSIFASSKANYSCRVGGVLTKGNGCLDVKLGSKTGEACHYTLLSAFSWGDKSVTEAMNQGNISVAKSIDYSDMGILRLSNILPLTAVYLNLSLFSQECVIVNGN